MDGITRNLPDSSNYKLPPGTKMSTNHWNYSDRTQFGNHDNTGRYIWIVFIMFALLSSLIGDSTILVAAIKYRAFKLHKLIVVIIQHIAVADLMVSATFLFPKIVSKIAGRWIFGKLFCNISPYNTYFATTLGIQLICAMTTSKVLILKYPLRSVSFSRGRAHWLCSALWVWALNFSLCFFIVEKEDVFFDYRIYTCDYGFSAKAWSWLKPLLFVVLVVCPNVLVIGTTLYLFVIARRSVARRGTDRLKWQGIMTTALTGAAYCISTLPYAVFRILEVIVDDRNKPESFFHTHYHSLANDFLFLNTISNIYIYSLTVPSFRGFLLSKVLWFIPSDNGPTSSDQQTGRSTSAGAKVEGIVMSNVAGKG
ncbi:hypothetical protein ACHWQZ_G010000 [Mnemiopsis leidyi]